MIFESEQLIYFVDQFCYALNLLADLLRHHKDVRIVLCKAAHAHQTVQLTGLLMTVYQTQLTHTKRQVTVRTRLRLVNKDSTRTVHRLDRKISIIDDSRVHIFFVVIPVTGSLPQMTAQHDRSGDFDVACFSVNLSPVIQKSIFQNHTVRQEERESRPLISEHKQTKLLTKLSVVTLLCLFHTGDVSFQISLLRKGGTIDSGQHLILLTASPVSACQACQLKCLYRLGAHQMWACTQVYKLALLIETDLGILWKILDQFYLIRLIFFLEIRNCIGSGLRDNG